MEAVCLVENSLEITLGSLEVAMRGPMPEACILKYFESGFAERTSGDGARSELQD